MGGTHSQDEVSRNISAGLTATTSTPNLSKQGIHIDPFAILDSKNVGQFGFDCGGSLTKLVYITKAVPLDDREHLDFSYRDRSCSTPTIAFRRPVPRFTKRISPTIIDKLQGTREKTSTLSIAASSSAYELHFSRFETFEAMEAFLDNEPSIMDFLQPRLPDWNLDESETPVIKSPDRVIYGTGGGAYKYSLKFKEKYSVDIKPQNEFRALIYGVNFLLRQYSEVFTFNSETRLCEFVNIPDEKDIYPYLLVNIGSGTSIIKVTGKDCFKRVSGSTMGGATYLGLCQLLTKLKDFDDIREVEKGGRNSAVDLMVRDIYGEEDSDYKDFGLKADVIAASFGKVSRVSSSSNTTVSPASIDGSLASGDTSVNAIDSAISGASTTAFEEATGELDGYGPEDITKSLLIMICNTLGQLAYLNAKIENTTAIYFAGGFLREKEYVWSKLQYAINYWSKGSMRARFFSHDGYLGALGSIMIAAEDTMLQSASRKMSEMLMHPQIPLGVEEQGDGERSLNHDTNRSKDEGEAILSPKLKICTDSELVETADIGLFLDSKFVV